MGWDMLGASMLGRGKAGGECGRFDERMVVGEWGSLILMIDMIKECSTLGKGKCGKLLE